jgi:choline dehydrogenase-like flavoprotein
VLQGQVVGGSTVVNDALCFTPPPELEQRWKAHGVTDVSPADLAPYVERVERVMSVVDIPRAMINKANYLVGLGAARLGWKGERLRHNSPGCVQCGYRHIGCAYRAKQSMNLTFVPAAVEAGAQLLAETRVHHLSRADGSWRVHTDKGELEAEHVVLCAGVVATPTILLRSGIAAGEGLQFHLQSTAYGDFEERVDGFNGIPMSYGVLEFADIYGHTGPGFLLEAFNVQALAFSVQPPFEGAAHEEALRRYRHLAGVLPLVRSKGRGRVTLVGDRSAIDYPIVEADAERVAMFYDKAVELFMAAGATRVLIPHRHVGWVTAPTPMPTMAPGSFYAYCAHPFGGANRGAVTDGVGRVPGHPNLWVLDSSAFPEAIGVNPQITIASLALQGAERLLAG